MASPYKDIDARLDRWAHWRRRANVTPTGGYRSVMATMQGESEAVRRRDRKVQYGIDSAGRIRDSLKRRITIAAAKVKRAIKAKDREAERRERDTLDRLRRTLAEVPKTTDQLSWAALIHGKGFKRDRDYPEEEETEMFFNSLPKYLRRVMHRNWVNSRGMTQEEHALEMNIAYSTFKSHVHDVKKRAHRYVWGKG